MTPRKKNTLLTLGAYAGAAISCLLLCGMVYASFDKRLNERIDTRANELIDERMDKRFKYLEVLMQTMATPEQKEIADKEFKRWENNK